MKFKTDIKSWILLIVCSVIWGSSFILMKRGLDAFTPIQVGSMRVLISSLVFVPFAFSYLGQVPKKTLLTIFMVAYTGLGLPPYLFTTAQTVIDSSTAGILNSLTPVFALILGIVFFKIKMDIYKIIGVMLGFAGVCFIFFGVGRNGFTANIYCLLVVLATILYAISSTSVKVFLQGINPFKLTALIFLFIGPSGAVVLLCTDIEGAFTHPGAMKSFAYICVLAVVNTSFANVLFNYLIQKSTAIFAQSVTYLMPVVAVFLGMADGESVSGFDIAAILFIFISIYLINIRKS